MPEALIEVRKELFNAILQSDLDKISKSFSEDIIYKNIQNTKLLKGKQSLKEKLVLLFECKQLALALSETQINLTGDIAFEWSSFTLFIDYLSMDESNSYEGSYSIIWKKRENEKWLITNIMDSTFDKFPL